MKAKITNTHRKKETIPVVLTHPKGILGFEQKSVTDLKYGESLEVTEEQIGKEIKILVRKGHAKLEQVADHPTAKSPKEAPSITIIPSAESEPKKKLEDKSDNEVPEDNETKVE